jgi:hypothetical protein
LHCCSLPKISFKSTPAASAGAGHLYSSPLQ